MPDLFRDNGHRGEQGDDGEAPIQLDPTLLLLLAAITLMFASSFVYARPAPSATPEGSKPETEVRESGFETLGTYDIVSQTAAGGRTLITYNDGEDDVMLSVDNANLAREAGDDNTVTVEEQTYDKVDAESGEVLREDVEPATYRATVHYDPSKREESSFYLVSLEKNGNAPAVLTYREGNGITDTVKLSPSVIEVVDDGSGLVEKVEEYGDDGIWGEHWTVHSLPG